MAEDLRESLALQIPPLSLAYVGDSIYDFFVRDRLIRELSGSLNKINSKKKDLVCAKAQSDVMEYYLANELLTEEELAVLEDGGNAESGKMHWWTKTMLRNNPDVVSEEESFKALKEAALKRQKKESRAETKSKK